ncbi:GDP-mannose mannosyl hydrolase [Acinetobacter sp. VNH17]|uniref:GDP-mannose mannosyl hydrolase n=1 Tax=Acinetobacter thutiue TaxID=2998078 RepID=A0ABT7WSB3_9GAMM|nr:GDP-mannose mannosyl hydrolase [Acinetobacter thutiue]MCY6413449.1 GDP-mannose mannosyl hydrolase [Acinetobacter thutiue]MDN0015558.1 GDP-mannose mannosyl hydrolase [Acinetobacter thutiue]
MWLSEDTFKQVVASTPLISIDLIVRDRNGKVLLGQRQNRPAQGYWFVPGGRIQKNESLDEAFKRLTQTELGFCYQRHQAQWFGVYQHFYTDSVFGAGVDNPSTHYVVLAYQLQIDDIDHTHLPMEQHQSFQWWDKDQLLLDCNVHQYTQDYFRSIEGR